MKWSTFYLASTSTGKTSSTGETSWTGETSSTGSAETGSSASTAAGLAVTGVFTAIGPFGPETKNSSLAGWASSLLQTVEVALAEALEQTRKLKTLNGTFSTSADSSSVKNFKLYLCRKGLFWLKKIKKVDNFDD